MPNYRESKYLQLTAVSRQSLCISIKTCRLKKRDWLRSYNTSLSAGCRSELLQWGLACLDLQTPPRILLQDMAERGARNQIPLALPKPQAQGIRDHNRRGLCSLFLRGDKYNTHILTLCPAPAHEGLQELALSPNHEVAFSAQAPPSSSE